MQGTVTENTINIATALAKQRCHYWLDAEDAIQDFLVFSLEHVRKWEPERGALATWIWNGYNYWRPGYLTQKGPIAVHLEQEEDVLAPPALDERHALSGRAAELLSLVPEAGRPLVETHLAYGVSLSATAELHGVTDRTVSRWVARAREIWSTV